MVVISCLGGAGFDDGGDALGVVALDQPIAFCPPIWLF